MTLLVRMLLVVIVSESVVLVVGMLGAMSVGYLKERGSPHRHHTYRHPPPPTVTHRHLP